MTILWAIVAITFTYYFLKLFIKVTSLIFNLIYRIFIGLKNEITSKKAVSKEMHASNEAPIPSLRVIAESMLQLDKSQDSWKIILDNQRAFLLCGNDEPEFVWNWTAGKYDLPEVKEEFINNKALLTLNDKSIPINYASDRSDGIRGILALSQLVSDQYEIRYCIDSWHSSDLAYLVLRHSDWQELETTYSSEDINYRFLSLPLSYSEFEAEAFTEENSRSYPKTS